MTTLVADHFGRFLVANPRDRQILGFYGDPLIMGPASAGRRPYGLVLRRPRNHLGHWTAAGAALAQPTSVRPVHLESSRCVHHGPPTRQHRRRPGFRAVFDAVGGRRRAARGCPAIHGASDAQRAPARGGTRRLPPGSGASGRAKTSEAMVLRLPPEVTRINAAMRPAIQAEFGVGAETDPALSGRVAQSAAAPQRTCEPCRARQGRRSIGVAPRRRLRAVDADACCPFARRRLRWYEETAGTVNSSACFGDHPDRELPRRTGPPQAARTTRRSPTSIDIDRRRLCLPLRRAWRSSNESLADVVDRYVAVRRGRWPLSCFLPC